MADISKADLKKEIAAILKDADLTTMSAKKVREELEDKLDCDLNTRKKEIDDLVMQCLKDKKSESKSTSKKNGKKDSDDEEGGAGEDEEEEEDAEEEDDAEEEASEEEEKPKRAAKKPTPKRKKGSSDESEEEDDKDSDDEYSPAKKAKGKPKGKGKGRKKKKGSDSDSDEDWAKNKKGKKSGGGESEPEVNPPSTLIVREPDTEQSVNIASNWPSKKKGFQRSLSKTSQQAMVNEAFKSLREEDEFDGIGTNVTCKLRRMDEEQKLMAEVLINKVLFNGIKGRLTEDTDITGLLPAEITLDFDVTSTSTERKSYSYSKYDEMHYKL